MAAELFPLILEESKSDIWVGVLFGFLFAFLFLNGFEHLINYFSEMRKGVDISSILKSLVGVSSALQQVQGKKKKCGTGDCGCKDCGSHLHSTGVVSNPMFGPAKNIANGHNHEHEHEHNHSDRSEHSMYGALETSPEEDITDTPNLNGVLSAPSRSPEDSFKAFERKSKVVCGDCTNVLEASSHGSDIVYLESDSLELALHAISDPEHKDHLQGHLLEMTEVIEDMEVKSKRFIENSLPIVETELLAEEVDEAVHKLQYQLDHCRRLLQGSEAKSRHHFTTMTSWLTEEKKVAMSDRLKLLRLTAVHLVDHIREDQIDEDLINEMEQHMKDMDRHIQHFHEAMDTWTSKWRHIPMPNIEYGATLPMSLVIPVTLDCFVDGFLIGVSVALSPKAGYVLSGANCLEMGSLGMAYSARIAKCTGSSFLNRQLAVYCPPILMLLSAGFGALLADSAHTVPSIFVAFVAFGVYALIALVCGELIIEAKEAHSEEEKWWINACLFLGVFMVLMVHPVL